MNKKLLYTCLLLLAMPLLAVSQSGYATAEATKEAHKVKVKSPHSETEVKFTENKNQWPHQVLYAAQLDGGMLFLEKNCFTYNFYDNVSSALPGI